MAKTAAAGTACLEWTTSGQPRSSLFGDCYFSRDEGIEESRYVFLKHNDLPGRWQHWSRQRPFVLVETGFGTGLNFLVTWHAWRQWRPEGARLHFVSIEGHPLEMGDLARALALWPQLEPLAKELIRGYPVLLERGEFQFPEDGIRLCLHLEDIDEALERLQAPVDAWYLDGFAPARNPAMWSPRLFETISSLSDPGARFSTFTAAGRVRRGLTEAGLKWEKVPGFGRKRHMLHGWVREPATAC